MTWNLQAKTNRSSIQKQMARLIPANSTLLEFGCGKGKLLYRLSSQICSGIGIDKSISHIHFAKKRQQQHNHSNIQFVCEQLGANYQTTDTYDMAVASLFFHVIPRADAVHLLNTMKRVSHTSLICGFSCPKTWQQKTFLWLDQKMTGHYRSFKEYKNNGYMEGLFNATNIQIAKQYDTTIPFIKIYKL